MAWTVNVEYDGVVKYTLTMNNFKALVMGKYQYKSVLTNQQFKRIRFTLLKDGKQKGMLETHPDELQRILDRGMMPFEIENYLHLFKQ